MALDLMNTVLIRAWTHRCPMVLKDVGALVEESAYSLDLKRVQKVDCHDYLSVK